ncbi:MAG TPA: hypothetical protein VG826_16065 [Pirellulales bacterium]|nr:hypothetical protein [Pirellulales bacterium]
MHSRLRLTQIVSVVGIALSGCGGAARVDKLPSLTEQMVATMKTIKDADSAKAAAPKLEELAGKVRAVQLQLKSGKAEAPSDPDQFQERETAALEEYGQELVRISSIPGAPQHLQVMIKKMTPDRGLASEVGSQLDKALAERKPDKSRATKPTTTSATSEDHAASRPEAVANPRKTRNTADAEGPKSGTAAPAGGSPPDAFPIAQKPQLRPDPNYKGDVADVPANSFWRKWLPTAKKGDFIEYEEGAVVEFEKGVPSRTHREVVDVVGEFAIIASVHQIGGSTIETRVRMKVGPEAEKTPGTRGSRPAVGSETISVAGRQLKCQVAKEGTATIWSCDEVPFDGVVKEERPGARQRLVAFGRGDGPSPLISAAAPASAPPAGATTPPPRPAPPGSSPPSVGTSPNSGKPRAVEKIEELQASIEESQQEIDRLDNELREANSAVDGLQKKVQRVSMSAAKSKRSKDAKGELQRELKEARSNVSKLERDLKRQQDHLARFEKELKKYQAQIPGAE